MLNNCEIKDTIEIYKWFDRTVNVQSHHQQAKCKGDLKTVDNDAGVSVYGWGGLQISLHEKKQVSKKSYLRENIIIDSGTTINPFENPSMITNRKKRILP